MANWQILHRQRCKQLSRLPCLATYAWIGMAEMMVRTPGRRQDGVRHVYCCNFFVQFEGTAINFKTPQMIISNKGKAAWDFITIGTLTFLNSVASYEIHRMLALIFQKKKHRYKPAKCIGQIRIWRRAWMEWVRWQWSLPSWATVWFRKVFREGKRYPVPRP